MKGSHAAKEAIGKTADEFKNNKELRKYTGITLGAGAVPIALAGGAAVASTEAGAAIGEMAYSAAKKALKESKAIFRGAEKVGKKTFKASKKKLYSGLNKVDSEVGLDNVEDFISAFNPVGGVPKTKGGLIGTIIANRDQIKNFSTKDIAAVNNRAGDKNIAKKKTNNP